MTDFETAMLTFLQDAQNEFNSEKEVDDFIRKHEPRMMAVARRQLIDSVWHKPDEPQDRSREPILRLHRDLSAGTLFFSLLKTEDEVQMMNSGIVAWCYFADLLPQWIKVYDFDGRITKKCVLRDDEITSQGV